jgi:glycosylphosphatidylinositol transamidase (GPIT) subunit GPI8
MKNVIFILLLLSLFQCSTSTRKRYQSYQSDVEELIDILRDKIPNQSEKRKNQDDSSETVVDPNDHVNVELWNNLNKDDIENMPEIDDYSDEFTARRWLKWYVRISQRYGQVRFRMPFDF